MGDTFRGYDIFFQEDVGFCFSDTGESTVNTWDHRPCGHCGRHNTDDGHDGCLGTLPGPVINACCGHGNPLDAYIQYADGSRIGGADAITAMYALGRLTNDHGG